MLLLTWRTNKIHLANEINRAGNTLLTETQDYIPRLGQRRQKPYSVQRHIYVLHRLYKGVLLNLGEEPSKRFSEAAGSVFWVSLPGLPGDTGSNYCDRGTQLTK